MFPYKNQRSSQHFHVYTLRERELICRKCKLVESLKILSLKSIFISNNSLRNCQESPLRLRCREKHFDAVYSQKTCDANKYIMWVECSFQMLTQMVNHVTIMICWV
jgi:hypothetical protein